MRRTESRTHAIDHTRDLLYELVVRDFKLRYKRSLLGVAWTLINPISQFLVLYFVFRSLLKQDSPTFPAFLFTGILGWTWFQTSVQSAASVVPDNPSLIRQTGFKVAVLPLVAVLSHLVNFLLSLPIALAVVLLTGQPLTWAIVALPVVVAVQFIFTLSLAYLFAALHVRFRDVQYLLGVGLMLGFYLSPVFYDVSLIPPQYHWVYHINPLTHILEGYRNVLLHGRWPFSLSLGIVAVGSGLLLTLTSSVFKAASRNFVEEL